MVETKARKSVPHDVQRDIAQIVRAVKWPRHLGGVCWYTNCAGMKTLQLIGLPAKLETGSLVYRCGPDSIRDVIAFAGPGNVGRFSKDGWFLGHIWVQSDQDLIDFSVGSWQEETSKTCGIAMDDRMPDGTPIDLPVWSAPPLPEFLWINRAEAKAKWRFNETPEIGEYWYGPMDGAPATFKAWLDDEPSALDAVTAFLTEWVERKQIRERILFANAN